MESVWHEHRITQRSQRLQRLQLAASAFLSEPATARDVRVLTLFVSIPTPSRAERAVTGRTFLIRKSGEGEAVSAVESSSRAATAAPTPAVASSSAKAPTKYTRSRARLFAVKHKRERAVQYCTEAALERIRQAKGDATELTRWLRSPDRSAPRSYGSHVAVTVAAVLTPRTVADLSLFIAWQSPSRDASNCSPLREADMVVLNLGGGSEAAEVVRAPARGRHPRTVDTYTSFFTDWESYDSPPIDLNALLLPHQSILLDITWCAYAGLAKHEESGGTRKPRGREKDGAASRALLDLRTFLGSFQGAMKLPKESRVACWLSYGAKGSASSMDSGEEDSEGGDGPASAEGSLFHHFGSISGIAPHTMALEAEDARDGRSGGAERVPQKERKQQTRKDFSRLHREFALLYRQLFSGADGPSMGRSTDGALLMGYGGAVGPLVAPANRVSLPAVGVVPTPNGKGQLTKLVDVSEGRRPSDALLSLSSSPSAALLLTRAQRDLFCFLGFLIGQEQADLHRRAAGFLRTLVRRLSLAACFASSKLPVGSTRIPSTVAAAPAAGTAAKGAKPKDTTADTVRKREIAKKVKRGGPTRARGTPAMTPTQKFLHELLCDTAKARKTTRNPRQRRDSQESQAQTVGRKRKLRSDGSGEPAQQKRPRMEEEESKPADSSAPHSPSTATTAAAAPVGQAAAHTSEALSWTVDVCATR